MLTQSQIDQIRDQVVAAAGNPQSVTVDGEAFTQRPLADLLAAYKFFMAQQAAQKPSRGLRFTKIVNGGAS